MDPPVIHENLEEGRTPKRMRSSPFTSPFNSPFGTSAHDYGIQQPPSPVNKGARFIELTTPTQYVMPRACTCSLLTKHTRNQAQPGKPFGDSDIVKLRAELSQLRLDFDAEKQQNDILRSQFEVERCLNGFLRGQTIAEQSVNKTLTAKLTALEERMALQEPTFVTLQNLKECLLTWLRDYLVNRAEGHSDAQL
jgi:hypothetical protein